MLLDLGLPLPTGKDDPPVRGRSAAELLASGVLPKVSGVYQGDEHEVSAVLMTHAHMDHFGLAPYVHPSIPVYATQGIWAAQRVLEIFSRAGAPPASQHVLKTSEPVSIGGLRVQAIGVDHSGCDAVALLVEGDGKRVLYTGDLRAMAERAVWSMLCWWRRPPSVVVIARCSPNAGWKPSLPTVSVNRSTSPLSSVRRSTSTASSPSTAP